MSWTFQGGLPVYQQIASAIRSDIIGGKYPPASQFPSVRQLAFEAAVNPNTMQRALIQLEQEGLLLAKGTVGRFVTEDPALLEKARNNTAKDLTEAFWKNCKQMGFSKEEIICLLSEQEEEE